MTHTHALFADQSQSILDDLAVLLGVELHAFSRSDLRCRISIARHFSCCSSLRGVVCIIWASDGFFPGAPDMVRARLQGTSPETQHGVLAGGALAFYGLN